MSLSFKTEAGALKNVLAHMKPITERRVTIPILAHVLIRAAKGVVSVTATDMENELTETLSSAETTNGAATTPVATLCDIVSKIDPQAVVEIAMEKEQLTLRSGNYSTSLYMLPVDDYPTMQLGTPNATFSVPAADLRGILNNVSHAISTEETRYYLNGIYFHAAERDGVKVLRGVATDGHRLARMDAALPEGAERLTGMIVARKTAHRLAALLARYSGDVDVGQSEANTPRITFRLPGITLHAKLIDGTFPNYTRVIPDGNNRLLRAETGALRDVVARVAAISHERSKPVKLVLGHDQITVSCHSIENGIASESLNGGAVKFDAAPFEIGFQARYLADLFAVMGSASVEGAFKDGSTPTLFHGADGAFQEVLMPMRI